MSTVKYQLDGELVTLKALKQRLPAHGEDLLKWAGQNGATTTSEYVDACERRRASQTHSREWERPEPAPHGCGTPVLGSS